MKKSRKIDQGIGAVTGALTLGHLGNELAKAAEQDTPHVTLKDIIVNRILYGGGGMIAGGLLGHWAGGKLHDSGVMADVLDVPYRLLESRRIQRYLDDPVDMAKRDAKWHLKK